LATFKNFLPVVVQWLVLVLVVVEAVVVAVPVRPPFSHQECLEILCSASS
jgi:hypothetical protein